MEKALHGQIEYCDFCHGMGQTTTPESKLQHILDRLQVKSAAFEHRKPGDGAKDIDEATEDILYLFNARFETAIGQEAINIPKDTNSLEYIVKTTLNGQRVIAKYSWYGKQND